jgi:DNA-binding CsgD family transcriptional regulator
MTHGDERGIAELERALGLARDAGAGEAESVALINLTDALARAGRLEASVELALEGGERCRRLGLERRAGLFLESNAAEVLVRLGRWDEAERLLSRAFELEPEGLTALALLLQQAELDAERGRPDAALAALAAAERIGAARTGEYFGAGFGIVRADALIAAGHPDEALSAARAAFASALAYGDRLVAVQALRRGLAAAADAADAARARRDAGAEGAARDAGEALWAQRPTEPWAAESLGAAELAGAAAERSRLAGTSDPEAWARAAAAWRAIPSPAPAARAELARAAALLASGAPRAVIADALAVVHATAQALGAPALEREVARIAAQARVPVPLTVVAPPEPGVPGAAAALGITARELEVLALVTAGRTNRQIADELVLSIKTAGQHVSSLLRKLGAANRGEAGALARRAGLVDEATLDRLLDADPR